MLPLLDTLYVLKRVIKKSDVDFSVVQPTTSAPEGQLASPGPSLGRFLATGGDRCEEYLGCNVADSADQRARFEQLRKRFIDQLVHNTNMRFPNDAFGLLSAMAVLDMETLPAKDGLAEHGVEKLELLLDHYGVDKGERAALLIQSYVDKSGFLTTSQG